ncbi:MAG: VCBS repeat-containing protein, partial [Pirellulaceae bacterium]
KLLQFWKRRRAVEARKRLPVTSPHRQCQFEEMEARRLCAVDPLAAGLVPAKQDLQEEIVQLPVSDVESGTSEDEGDVLEAVGESHAAGMSAGWQLPAAEEISRPGPRPLLELPAAIGFSSPDRFVSIMNSFPQIPFYGSSYQVQLTWHLSILNAGSPRFAGPNASVVGTDENGSSAGWHTSPWISGEWQLGRPPSGLEDDSPQKATARFGMPGGVPVAGDWNGDGVTELGVYHQGRWQLDLNGNGTWDDDDLWVELGEPTDQPVVGDWDGDGKDDIGILAAELPGERNSALQQDRLVGQQKSPGDFPSGSIRRRTMQAGRHGENRRELVDHVFHHGMSHDTPVAGDWNGDGVDTIGAYRDGHWHLDTNGDGRLDERDQRIVLGRPGDLPVVGDWDGDGVDQLGVVRQGTWMLDSDANGKLDVLDEVFGLGDVTENPVVGDWVGDGADQPGSFRQGSMPRPSEAPGSGI